MASGHKLMSGSVALQQSELMSMAPDTIKCHADTRESWPLPGTMLVSEDLATAGAILIWMSQAATEAMSVFMFLLQLTGVCDDVHGQCCHREFTGTMCVEI